MQKITYINQETVKEINSLRNRGKKIVLCHGAFDLVHPGHMEHFQRAKLLGDILIVTITGDRFIKKNIQSPYFDEETRYDFLNKIKIIDYVFVVNHYTAVPVIQKFRPHYYCKGIEYKNSDNVGNLELEKKALYKSGGKLKFLGKNVQSSSKFISKIFFKLDDKIIKSNLSNLKLAEVQKTLNKLKNLKVLIVGESIIDQYTYVEAKGVSPKSSTLSCVTKTEQIMPGGVLATYKFLSSFVKSVSLISLINSDLFNEKKYKKLFSKVNGLIKSKNYSKIIKNRVIESYYGDKKIKKLLTLNEFEDKKLSNSDERLMLNRLNRLLPKIDIVIVQDFGHNFFTQKIINLIQKKSKKLSLNVQSNSLNYGFNIIGKKFTKTDFYTLDERELELFSAKKNIDHLLELKKLNKYLTAEKGFLTCGGKFSLVVEKNKYFKIPTLNKNAVDSVGAGDIFHSMSSLLSTVTKNNFLTLLLSQIAGAHSASIVGNSDYPKLPEILNTFKFYKNSIKE